MIVNWALLVDRSNMIEACSLIDFSQFDNIDYKQNCAVCHGLPGEEKTTIAQGMYPDPPQLFHGTGVTDDPAWETHWKAENGIRMTGMPGFKGRLTEKQLWQVSQLLANADKISPAVKAELTSAAATPAAAEKETKRASPICKWNWLTEMEC